MAGQVALGSITGVVDDSAGAVIPQALLTLLNVETKIARSAHERLGDVRSPVFRPVGTS